tara:strand:+ start:423 stop:683 length:261 start_codon:yes stop_codon:yes gene_type:complete
VSAPTDTTPHQQFKTLAAFSIFIISSHLISAKMQAKQHVEQVKSLLYGFGWKEEVEEEKCCYPNPPVAPVVDRLVPFISISFFLTH